MKRRLFTIAAAVSLVICVASLVLWARSYWHFDRGGYYSSTWEMWTASRSGCIQVGITCGNQPGEFRTGWWGATQPARRFEFERFYFVSDASTLGMTWRFWGAGIPHWSLALSAAVLPIVGCARLYRRHTRGAVLRCERCGYDLRATPDRCPECGMQPLKRSG